MVSIEILPRGPTPTLFSVEVSSLATCFLMIRVQQQEEECYINLTLLQSVSPRELSDALLWFFELDRTASSSSKVF